MNDASIVIGIVGAGIVLLFIRLSMLERRLNRLSRLDAKVDALLKDAGIHFDPFRDVAAVLAATALAVLHVRDVPRLVRGS